MLENVSLVGTLWLGTSALAALLLMSALALFLRPRFIFEEATGPELAGRPVTASR